MTYVSGLTQKKKDHSEINEISEYDGYSNLKNVLKLKIFPQNDQLQHDQKDTEKDHKVSKCKRKIKT